MLIQYQSAVKIKKRISEFLGHAALAHYRVCRVAG